MKEQTENADAIQKEFELVGELYEEEKKYRQLYSQCVTDVESTLSPVEKKNITEVYQRYQDFYHPVLFPTQLYANTEFIFEAYRQDGREAIRLRNEENTFATKSQNIATQRIPKYEQDHIFPLRTFQNVLAGKIPFTRDQVARLLQKFSNREIFEMFGTKEGVTVDFVAKQLHPDLKKKKEYTIKKIQVCIEKHATEMNSTRNMGEFYEESAKRAREFQKLLLFDDQKIQKLSSYAKEVETTYEHREAINQVIMQALTNGNRLKLCVNLRRIREQMKSYLNVDPIPESIAKDPEKCFALGSYLYDDTKEFLSLDGGVAQLTEEFEQKESYSTQEAVKQYDEAIRKAIGRWKYKYCLSTTTKKTSFKTRWAATDVARKKEDKEDNK